VRGLRAVHRLVPTGIDITQEVSALASLQDAAAPDEDTP
jgi:hypothetical protein